MSFLPDELPVALDKLEDHLRAILKIKIREFVHLNPIFNCIPSIDVDIYNRALTDAAVKVEQSLQPVVQIHPALKLQNDGQAAQPIIALPEGKPQTSLEPISRSQFRQNILGNGQVSSRPPEEVGLSSSNVPLSSKSYFAGFDVDCPNQSRQLPTRRRYSRRSTV
ncbi:hypothetical protein KBI23_06260 [bacterium]|nr:hypothetical protein [bacterium]MBP9809499.1 hypothetical protein [bacterium]